MLKDCKYLLEECKAISHKTLVHKFFSVFDTKIDDTELLKHYKKKLEEDNLNFATVIKDAVANFEHYSKTD